jgi:hypothetical protein
MTTKTITIAKAIKQLNIPEEKLRETLKPLYPDSWQSIKNIKIDEFETIVEALRNLAASEGISSEFLAEDTPEDTPEDSNLVVAESSDLTPQQAQDLKVSTIRTFSDFAIDLSQITQALAYSTALKNFADFKEIHSRTFRHHAEQYINDFGQEYQQTLSDLNEQCNPKYFLQEQGILP